MSADEPRTAVWPALVCAAVAVLLLAPSVGFGYVYDDHRFVEGNEALGHVSVLWRAFTDPSVQTADGTHAGLYRPLRTLSFALDRAVFGTLPAAAHAVNVLLHGAATGLLARLLQGLRLPALAAAAGALVYAVHPVQVESVAWISSRGDVLASLLVIAALVLQRPGFAARAWLLGAAALLAKEQAIVWPALAFLTALLRGRGPREAVRIAAVPALLAASFLALRFSVLDAPFQQGGLPEGRAAAATIGLMLGHQWWYAVLPVGAAFDWQMGAAAGGGARLALGLAALSCLAPLVTRTARVPALWFLVALAPTLFAQVLVPLNIRVADRFLLLALPALSLLVARAVAASPRAAAAAGSAVVCLAALTSSALPAWASDATLWESVVRRTPGHWRARAWLGTHALSEGDVEAAVRELEWAARLAPEDAKTRFRLAEALEARAARAGRRPGDEVAEATKRARDAYAAAVALYRTGRRNENGALLEPVARLRAIDLTLALGDVTTAATALTVFLDGRRPEIPPGGSGLWNETIDRVVGHVAEHLDPTLEHPLAPHLAAWKMRR